MVEGVNEDNRGQKCILPQSALLTAPSKKEPLGITDLTKLAGLKSPFEKGALSEVASFCEKLLEKLDK